MKKRIVVLGGAGVLGRNLCSKLVSEGQDVVCIDNRDAPKQMDMLHELGRFNYIKHDVTKVYDVGCDQIYNLASPRNINDNIDSLAHLRLGALGCLNTLNCALREGARVLYGSADDVYNFNHVEIDYYNQNYFIAEACRTGEAMHRSFHKAHMMDIRIARIFSTFGSGNIEDRHVVTKMIIEALSSRDIYVYGSGEQIRTFCWVDDMVDGLIKMMAAHSPKGILTLDLGSSFEISIRNLAELIISLCGSHSRIHHIESRVDDPRYKSPQYNTTHNQIGWQATTPLKEGLLRYINYIEKELSLIKMKEYSWVEIHG